MTQRTAREGIALRFGKEFYEILQCNENRQNGEEQATLEQ
jgi:hypothetical protein